MEDTYIKLENVARDFGRLSVHFSFSENLAKFFKGNIFYIEMDIDFNEVPESVAVIPFLCNVLPIVWLSNARCYIKTLDAEFIDSIPDIKSGYQNMYPMLDFRGEIVVKDAVNNDMSCRSNSAIGLFSGGVDAVTTALRHIDEPLTLLSVWGSADFPLNDKRGWNIHYRNMQQQAELLKKPLRVLRSNFYLFIDNWGSLNDLIKESGESWWHGFQHGIGLISLSAPFAYVERAEIVYIASTFPIGWGFTCASTPTIDNKLHWGYTRVFHDGYELSRQDKTHYIVNHKTVETGIPMHVCLKQYQVSNCCKCEKCYRTILAILAEGKNPDNFGFSVTPTDIKRIISDIKYKTKIKRPEYYQDIQNAIIANISYIDNPDIRKFAHYPISRLQTNMWKRFRHWVENSALHNVIIKFK